jgi:hypothetical protein
MRAATLVLLLVVTGFEAILALGNVGPAHGSDPGRGRPPDSVTVRVAFRIWGGELEQCTGLNWGWDSLTLRLTPGKSFGGDSLGARFTLGHIVTADSAWLIYPMRKLGLYGRQSDPVRSPEFDSVIVTPRPTAFNTINVKDAEVWYRVTLSTPWPEPPRKPMKTTTLAGRVVDDSTGCGMYFCQVVVDGTRCSAYTDTLGAFVLARVPIGEVGINACSGDIRSHVVVRVPRDKLVIRLPHDPRRRFMRPCH